MSRTNKIYIIIILIVLVLFGIFRYYESQKDKIDKAELEALTQQYNQEAKQIAEEEAEKEAHYAKIREDIPGIICWGDDMTYGKGGINKSYPYVLENLLNDNDYEIPVYNNGVSGEDSLTVLGREGAIPYQVEEFTIDNARELIEVKVTSSYGGEKVNPLLKKRNPGINPCKINGVEGILYGYVKPAKLDKVDTFFFARNNTGEKVEVEEGTHIETLGTKYRDYVNILAVGDNGGYDDNDDLLEQYKMFVKYLEGSKNGNNYLVLGRIKGDKDSNEEFESMMEDEFGKHYLNVRNYLCTEAMNDLKLTAAEEDKKAMENGEIPPSLMFDENNLNDRAYEAIGSLVYKRLVENNFVRK